MTINWRSITLLAALSAALTVPSLTGDAATGTFSPTPFVVFASSAARAGGYTPADIDTAYGVSSLQQNGLTGSGQRIGLIELDGFSINDVAAFDSAYNLPPVTIRRIKVPGGSFSLKQQGEATMDIEWSHAMAPGAAIDVYLLKDTKKESVFWNETAQALQEAQSNGDGTISISWGVCRPATSSSVARSALASLEAGGTDVFVSSGDYGALAGPRKDCGSTPDVAYPASDPSVVAVGGTTLSLNRDGTIADQTAWRLSGGGVTTLPKPVWQITPGLLAQALRNAPDVSFDGDPNSGVLMLYKGKWQVAAGTSLGAPCWAGIWSLIRQDASQSGKTLGPAAPLVYTIGNSAAYSQAFDDITTGSNGKYSAGIGWDAVTGWGTPNAAALASQALNAR